MNNHIADIMQALSEDMAEAAELKQRLEEANAYVAKGRADLLQAMQEQDIRATASLYGLKASIRSRKTEKISDRNALELAIIQAQRTDLYKTVLDDKAAITAGLIESWPGVTVDEREELVVKQVQP